MSDHVELTADQENKLARLKEIIADYGSLAVGFSGGADPHAFEDYLYAKYGDRIECKIPAVMEEITYTARA